MVRCYTSPSAATLGRLALPFLFPELSDFTAEADLTSLLHSLDARSQAILLAENKPPYISLFTCSRLASLALFAPLSFFEGCSSSLLAPSVASTATADLLSVEEVSTASAPSGRRRSRGGRTRGGDHGGGVGGSGGGGGGSGGDGGRGRHGGGGGGREGAERGGGGSGGSRGGVDGGAGPGSAPEGVVAASLCACESASTGAVPVEALHTLTLDSCVSRCFFRDCTIVTTLAAPDPVTLADPLFGPVVAHGTTILLCPTAPSGSLTGFHLPLFAMNLSVEPSGPYPELVGCLMYLMTCTQPDLAYPLSLLARYVAPVRRAWGSCLEDGLELSSLVTQTLPGSSCEAEIYAGAMVALELRWLTYLLTDLGEAPRSPPVLYVDNKAMLALCHEHRLEHRMKHIALCYFLARELQQRGQLRLAYVTSRANTADVFTKALQPCDHQPCFAFLDRSCGLLFSTTLPMGVCQTYML
ncbi:unnamed protein product [Closterium sp. NIES-53]